MADVKIFEYPLPQAVEKYKELHIKQRKKPLKVPFLTLQPNQVDVIHCHTTKRSDAAHPALNLLHSGNLFACPTAASDIFPSMYASAYVPMCRA